MIYCFYLVLMILMIIKLKYNRIFINRFFQIKKKNHKDNLFDFLKIKISTLIDN